MLHDWTKITTIIQLLQSNYRASSILLTFTDISCNLLTFTDISCNRFTEIIPDHKKRTFWNTPNKPETGKYRKCNCPYK